jgi:hypothetical protein
VRGLPTFLVVKDGRVSQQIVGAVTKKRLTDAIDAVA